MRNPINYSLAERVSSRKNIFECSFKEISNLEFQDYFQSRLFRTSERFKEPLLALTAQTFDHLFKPFYLVQHKIAKYSLKRLTQ